MNNTRVELLGKQQRWQAQQRANQYRLAQSTKTNSNSWNQLLNGIGTSLIAIGESLQERGDEPQSKRKLSALS